MASEGWFWFDLRGDPGALEMVQADLIDTSPSGCQEMEDGAVLRIWWPLEADAEKTALEVARACGRRLARMEGRGFQAPEDWLAEWRKHRVPVRAGRRVWITPPEKRPEAEPGEIVAVIDQRMAFGSGHHATTRLCVAMLEDHVREGCRVLDVGSGSGVLSVVAALLGAGEVTAVEADGDVLPEASDNLARNGVEDRVRLVHAPFEEAPAVEADLVVSNMILGRMLPSLGRMATSVGGGPLLLSGIEEEQREEFLQALSDSGLALEEERSLEGWLGFVCR
jgi:ribosomal protein L11 methyltransferase